MRDLTSLLLLAILGAAPGCMIVCGPHQDEGPATRRAVGLTFDDGPLSPATGQVLDLLRAARARATFFVVGANVRRHPDLARRIVEEGHELGNHTESHLRMLGLYGPRCIAEEVDRGEEAIRAATGARTRLFRMPNGFTSHWVPPILAERGLVHVTFSFRTYDSFHLEPRTIVRRVLEGVRPGSILVLHDGFETEEADDRSGTLEALPLILAGLEARGYEVVGAAELLGIDWRLPEKPGLAPPPQGSLEAAAVRPSATLLHVR